MIGRTLGHFEVLEVLGSGGMGTVYLARDLDLGRDVALKVLPPEVTDQPERAARFRREAQLLASLSHPSVATIHEVGSQDEVHYLVMELAPGVTLAERLARGPIPPKEALEIALRVAAGLGAAHGRGIVHRDLKPANVAVAADGSVKILDFGLAKALQEAVGESHGEELPTVSYVQTRRGAILGTPAYMSPEQARGEEVDARCDIWALGCILYEMLAGERPFAGRSSVEVLGAVVGSEPSWGALPEGTSGLLRQLLRHCLAKEPERRLRAAGDVELLLEDALVEAGGTSGRGEEDPRKDAAPLRAGWGTLAIAGLALLLVGLGAGFVVAPRAGKGGGEVLHLGIRAPEGAAFHLDPSNPGPAVLSPDGDKAVFTVREASGVTRLYVRALEEPDARLLPGTEGAQYPFWSPDGEWVAFFGPTHLSKVSLAGTQQVIHLADAIDGKGGSWSPEGVIVYAPGTGTPIHRISAEGGPSEALTEIDGARHNSHRHPRFLPSGRSFLYVARALPGSEEGSALLLGSLEGGESRQLLTLMGQGEFAAGKLLYVDRGVLQARPFDPERGVWTGRASSLVAGVFEHPGAAFAAFSVSRTGRLIYQRDPSSSGVRTALLKDRDGRTLADLGGLDFVSDLSADASRALVAVGGHLWIFDLESGSRSRLTYGAGTGPGLFSPDATSVVYSSAEGGDYDLFRVWTEAPGESERLLDAPSYQIVTAWSPDGRFLAYSHLGSDGSWPVSIMDLENPAAPRQFTEERTNGPAAFSPDGRWLAYVSDASGRSEVYVTSFPRPSRRWQVSENGGVAVWWPRHGNELLYQDAEGRIFGVPVELSSEGLRFALAVELFSAPPPTEVVLRAVAPSAAGDRFLVLQAPQFKGEVADIVLGWTALLDEAESR